jgi:hypothetical protein
VGSDQGDPQEALSATRKGLQMPEKKHLRGFSEKERQYEHVKEQAEKEGRYRGRDKEVAARTVLKQHKEKGTAKAAEHEDDRRRLRRIGRRRAGAWAGG